MKWLIFQIQLFNDITIGIYKCNFQKFVYFWIFKGNTNDVKGVAAQGLAKPTPRGRRIQTIRETLDAKSEFLQA